MVSPEPNSVRPRGVRPYKSALPLRHVVVIWLVLLVIIGGAFAATVVALNSTVFSAGGFVGSYLSALQRHDVREVLTTPGVLGVAKAGTQLLEPGALSTLDNITQLSDDNLGAGLHLVSFEYTVDGTPASSSFQVQYQGTRLGFFSLWSFEQSPIAVLQVTPMHAAEFTVNGVSLASSDGPSTPTSLQVLTPGKFTLTHESTYLEAQPVSVLITQGNTVTGAQLDILANAKFVSAVQSQVDSFLDNCAKQTVLFPTGCPFGQELSNRVESVPAWSMTKYPAIAIEPGNTPGTWLIPEAQGAAHLKVDVRSLFDGTLSTFDQDVQFSLTWVITFSGNSISIDPQ